jgi:uncharacterized damage-inducible protein DinB
METHTLGKIFLHELNAEVPASRKCLERIPDNLFGWKPHEKSMGMGYLALLVAAIPEWITHTVEDKLIDFAKYKQFQPKNNNELIKYFDESVAGARKILEKVSDEEMTGMFYLKNNEQVLMSTTINETISSSLNHWVHHRGQLTVYMRLNNIPVPSIYGPSADEKSF